MQQVVHVWFDRGGNIAAVGQPRGEHHVVPLSRGGLRAVEALVESGAVEDLQHTHRADPSTGRLVER